MHKKKSVQTEKIIDHIRTLSSDQWLKVRERTMLDLFHEAAERVPAYRDFLKKNKVKHKSIETLEDFAQVPITNKANYLRQYPLKDLVWDGDIQKPYVFAATSGSTGKPFYFPHERELSEQYSVLTELYLKNSTFGQKPALVIICFGMGVWIGGVFTFQAFELASERGSHISIISPGINKDEIINALRELSPNFSQTVLVGYPPFIKDLLDDAALSGIALPRLNIRLLFAAESFGEQFRDHLAKSAGIKNVLRDTLNIYGTADIGAMAFETPTSILLRRKALENQDCFSALFGDTQKLPTLAQYNPYFTNFEAPNGEILLTGTNSIPLIRYAVGDRGGTTSMSQVEQIAGLSKKVLRAEAKKHAIDLYNLPFVYVYERADFSVKLYGAIIYAEHVREALQNLSLQKHITGKFMMRTQTDKDHNQFLELNVELNAHGKESTTLAAHIQKVVVSALLEKNSEYANNYASMKDRVVPKIVFWPHEHPTYFKSGVKQKWVVKS